MSCYNCEKTINKSIDSILAQTYTDWVMVCCDDGSADNTFSILKDYKNRYPDKFVILRNEQNRKLAYSLNRCLEHVKTDLVARMDADDESMPDRFEKQVRFLSEHPEYIVCGTRILIHSELSGREYTSDIDEHPDKYTLHRHTPFNHATIMCRKEMYDVLGGYTDVKSTIRCEDKELWYRFYANGLTGANLTEPLYMLVEDKDLIYRSTAKSRWNGFMTEMRGYWMLKYPFRWYFRPFLNLFKVLVPRCFIAHYYRLFRGKKG